MTAKTTPKILVTGAPGNVGSEVVRGLQALNIPIRLAAFSVEAAQKAFGDDPNVEIVHFDFLDPHTYARTFDGIERLFLVRPPNLADVPKEIAPALYAAKEAGVKHFVFLSLQGVEKQRMVPHYKIEQLLQSMDVTYTFLRASFFMQNLSTTHRDEIKNRNEIAVPVGKSKTSFIDVRDIGAVAVRALTEAGHENKIYTLTGREALDYYTVAETLTDELGRAIRYTNPNVLSFFIQQVRSGRPFGFTLIMAGLYTITRFGNAKDVTDDVRRLLGRNPISFVEFAHDYRQSWA
jgi:uncharacterized protein YbjT (DUF2867 family)